MNNIYTCFSPSWYHLYAGNGNTVAVIDVMRATTSICAALEAGAEAIIPVGSVEDARKAKDNGFILAAERDGIKLDYADFGNSPDAFSPERVKGKEIAYSTTNGTQAINMAAGFGKNIAIAAFVNLSAVSRYLAAQEGDIVLFCAGWKDRFSLEDSLCAGAIAGKIMETGRYTINCDSTLASIDLWNLARNDVFAYIQKCTHRHRMRNMISDDVVRYCHTPDLLNVVPVWKNGRLVKA
jgi:2-phosphosulfolactate phosphatase